MDVDKIDKALDFEYLKLTVALVLLLIIIFLITSRFRTYPIEQPASTGFAEGTAEKKENFAPYASILSPSIFRSDASHDIGKIDNPPDGNYADDVLNSNYVESFVDREYHSYPTRDLNPELVLLSGLTTTYEDETLYHKPHECCRPSIN